ncbi:hypothetical protein CDAR_299311 [Caerostris darwini]|uniref:Uncharacterized protein n=1 Tax=Caerostris darwini TaxID=1538125 RepID=A0AAV4RM34_9ARAC|nr:hypothetical protein CDAR_299311 [Caerostris darwini]
MTRVDTPCANPATLFFLSPTESFFNVIPRRRLGSVHLSDLYFWHSSLSATDEKDPLARGPRDRLGRGGIGTIWNKEKKEEKIPPDFAKYKFPLQNVELIIARLMAEGDIFNKPSVSTCFSRVKKKWILILDLFSFRFLTYTKLLFSDNLLNVF